MPHVHSPRDQTEGGKHARTPQTELLSLFIFNGFCSPASQLWISARITVGTLCLFCSPDSHLGIKLLKTPQTLFVPREPFLAVGPQQPLHSVLQVWTELFQTRLGHHQRWLFLNGRQLQRVFSTLWREAVQGTFNLGRSSGFHDKL